MKKISCIIPAYNEEKNIWNILNVVIPFLWEKIFEIIVIDDCSSDKTWEIVKNFPEVKYLKNEKNLWKSWAVAKAILSSNWDYIFLLDADLLNLNQKNIDDFLKPIFEEKSAVVLAFRKNSWPLFPFKKIDYCIWERIIEKKFFLEKMEEMKNLKSYWLEVFINKIIIENKLSISVVKWENVENDFHHKKDWFFIWWKKNLKIWKNILKNGWWIFWIYKMNFDLEKLLK